MPKGFQIGAFQSDKTGPNKGFQVDSNAPASQLLDQVAYKQISLDSTMELIADRFNVEALGTNLFEGAEFGDTLTIVLGLKDPFGGPDLTITHMQAGFVDEYELTIQPKSQTINIRGRDQSSLILDRIFEKTYVYAAAQGATSATLQGDQTTFVGGGELQQSVQAQVKALQQTSVLYPAGHLFQIGVFTARQVAADICRAVGLQLVWQVRDYTLRKTFAAKGRVAKTLRQLVQPWQQVEPFKADVFLQGSTVIVRYRQLPTAPMTPQYSLDVVPLRRAQIKIRKRFTRVVGKLKLLGQLVPVPSSNVTVIANAEDEVTIVQESFAPDPSVSALGFSPTSVAQISGAEIVPGPTQFAGQPPTGAIPTGNGVIRTVVTTRYRLPQQIVDKQTKDTYAPFLTFHEETSKDYEDADTGPREIRSVTATKEFDTSVNALLDSKRVTKTTTYDGVAGQVQAETTITELFDTTANTWSGSTMVTRTFTDVAPGMVEIVTEQFASASTQGVNNALNNALWSSTSRDSQIAAGHRAGGAGRGIFIPNGSGNLQPIELDKVLSTATFAEPVEYSNENLNLADLQFLQSLFIAENALSFEFEVMLTGVAIPWLARGDVVQITGVKNPTGAQEIVVPPLLVTEIRTTYDESQPGSHYVNEIRAFGWK